MAEKFLYRISYLARLVKVGKRGDCSCSLANILLNKLDVERPYEFFSSLKLEQAIVGDLVLEKDIIIEET